MEQLLSGYHAILGGSFDPVHNGHLHIARQIITKTTIAKIVFVPCGFNRLKQHSYRFDYLDRLKMTRLAVAPLKYCEVGDFDNPDVTTGFTADLMLRMYNLFPNNNFCFVIGSDIVSQLNHWHDYQWLNENVHFLILPRPGYNFALDELSLSHYTYLPIDLSPVSSTLVRSRLDAGLPVSDLVPDTVNHYILTL